MIADENGWFIKVVIGFIDDRVFDVGYQFRHPTEGVAEDCVILEFVLITLLTNGKKEKSYDGDDKTTDQEYDETDDG